jgi:predicted lipoprotein with Yx(FWY)xxD motif
VFVAVAVLVVGLTACGSSSPPRDSALPLAVPTHVTVQAMTISGLGRVLADGAGHALYLFPPDAGGRVSCTGACAGTWPPLVIVAGDRPTASAGVAGTELDTRPDPNTGGRIVTYNGHPLYRYAGDVIAGTANGQGLFLNGGPWYTITPAGQPVTSTGGDR